MPSPVETKSLTKPDSKTIFQHDNFIPDQIYSKSLQKDNNRTSKSTNDINNMNSTQVNMANQNSNLRLNNSIQKNEEKFYKFNDPDDDTDSPRSHGRDRSDGTMSYQSDSGATSTASTNSSLSDENHKVKIKKLKSPKQPNRYSEDRKNRRLLKEQSKQLLSTNDEVSPYSQQKERKVKNKKKQVKDLLGQPIISTSTTSPSMENNIHHNSSIPQTSSQNTDSTNNLQNLQINNPQGQKSKSRSKFLKNSELNDKFDADNDEKFSAITKILFIAAMIFIVFSCLALYFNGPDLLLGQVLSTLLTLNEKSEFFKSWSKVEGDHLYISFYLFNLTNKDAFLDGKEYAQLEEIGPITYKMVVDRVIVSRTESNLTYWNNRKHYFYEEMTATGINPKTTKIIHPNLPKIHMMVTSAFVHIGLKTSEKFGVFKDTKELFIETTIDELLWGKEYDMLKWGQKFDKSLPAEFGLLVDQNDTFTTQYTVNKGSEKLEDLLKIEAFKNKNNETYQCWVNDNSNKIKGTDIEQVSPKKFVRTGNKASENTTIDVFIEDAFRSFTFSYKGEFEHPYQEKKRGGPQTSYQPIPISRYEQTRDSFGSSGNGQYCPRKYSQKVLTESTSTNSGGSSSSSSSARSAQSRSPCQYDDDFGLFDIGKCRHPPINFPLLWSAPYYHMCQKDYLKNITGITKPNEEKLKTYIDIEPNTGVVISARRRAQLSIGFENINYNPKELSKLKTKIYPLFWYDFPYEASDTIKKQMSTQLVKFSIVLRCVPYFLIALAMVLVTVAFFMNLQVRKNLKRKISQQKDDNKKLLSSGEDRETDSIGDGSSAGAEASMLKEIERQAGTNEKIR